MPEMSPKLPQNLSPPVATAGAGDISERELSRERHKLSTTPPARIQPAHPKKQLFSTPVNKFTAKSCGPSPNLARIRTCLHEYTSHATPVRRVKFGPKAASMEDLTPTKRVKRERKDKYLPVVHSSGPRSAAEEQAAARICRFMLVSAWRKRREEVRCVRKTLETQVTCSERLRIQVSTLKSLLDSDNMKVRLAMKELERLKQMLHDKDMEKAVLEREKIALEGDVCAADDRASEMSIGWRNSRNELESARGAAALCEHALSLQRVAASEARAQRDHAYQRLSALEAELFSHEALLTEAEAEVATLRREAVEKQQALDNTTALLTQEQQAHVRVSAQCAALEERVVLAAREQAGLHDQLQDLRHTLHALQLDLQLTKEQLHWWPKPLTRMMGAARYWLQHPLSLPEALLWAVIPARHGC